MARILIAGGTGLIGTALTKLLLYKGHTVTVLTRNVNAAKAQPRAPIHAGPHPAYATWNPDAGSIDEEAISTADCIINLAGAGIADQRWTKKRKGEIVSSRVNSCKTIASALKRIPNNVRSVVHSSAIGWYGPDPEVPNPHPFVESDPPDDSFLGNTCHLWEAAIEPVKALNKRLVIIRTAVVLSTAGGALPQFLKPLRFGIAPILHTGRQIISWIHIDDLCGIFLRAIEDEKLNGVYNGVAPQPVSNRSFTLTLARQVRGRFFIPIFVPAFVLKMALGEMSVEVLKSTTVSSRKIEQAGFIFRHRTLADALKAIIG